jgi:hypothetical protein
MQCGVRISETGIRVEINPERVVRERLKIRRYKKKMEKEEFW